MSKPSKRVFAAAIVRDIVTDLSDRRGLKQEWSRIDHDIKREIVKAWCELTLNLLREMEEAREREGNG